MSARSTTILAFQVLAVVFWLFVLAMLAAILTYTARRLADTLRRRTTHSERRRAEDAELARRYRPNHLDLHQREEGRQP